MSKRKTISFSTPLETAVEEICTRKGLTFQAFVITAVDEKVRREKDDYKEGVDYYGSRRKEQHCKNTDDIFGDGKEKKRKKRE